MKMMRVDQVMNQPPISCRGYETLNHAAHLMWEHDCGAIPVVNDRDEVVGIITDRDICMAAYSTGDRLADIPVARIMARRVYSVRPDHSVEDAEQKLRYDLYYIKNMSPLFDLAIILRTVGVILFGKGAR